MTRRSAHFRKRGAFSTGAYRVPEPDALAEAMQSSQAGLVQLDGISVTLTNGAQLDLGGIAKGYAAGRVRTILREAGVTSAIISLGGNVAAVGKKPDGSAWTVGLQDRTGRRHISARFPLKTPASSPPARISGILRKTASAITIFLDPHTGCPAESGVKSVSVVAQDDTLADALSTALFVMGLDAGAEFQKSSGLAFEAVFVTDDNTVWITPGLAGRYRPTGPIRYWNEAEALDLDLRGGHRCLPRRVAAAARRRADGACLSGRNFIIHT